MKSRQAFNYHTHTKRCGHAVGEDEAYIQAAIQAGFTTLGFSEHLGYEGWDDEKERIPFLELQDYLDTMNHYKEKYKDQINIRVGFEFEFFEDRLPFLKDIQKRCDYLINGQHAIALGNDDYMHDHCSDEEVMIYAHQICRAMEEGLTNYLAHPDYFMLGRKDFSPACAKAIDQIAACAAKYHIPVEVNLKGIKYGLQRYPYGERYIYPHREAFEIITKHGCNLVFGYDAHHPDALLDHAKQEDALQALKGLDLHFISDLSL